MKKELKLGNLLDDYKVAYQPPKDITSKGRVKYYWIQESDWFHFLNWLNK